MNSGMDSRHTSSSEACGSMIASASTGNPMLATSSVLDAGPVCHQCSACTFASEDHKIFARHLKRDHRPSNQSDSDSDCSRRSLFPCDQGCTFETDRFDAYRSHFTAHSRFHRDTLHPAILRYFQCPLCPYVSSVMLAADSHMDSAHADDCSSFTVQRVKLPVDVPTLPVSVSSPTGRICTGRDNASETNASSQSTTVIPALAPAVPSPPPLIHHGVRPPPPVYPTQRPTHTNQLAPPPQQNHISSASYRSPLEHMQDMQRYQQHQQQHHRSMAYRNQSNGYSQQRPMTQHMAHQQHRNHAQQHHPHPHHHHQGHQQLNAQIMDPSSHSYPPSEQCSQSQQRRRLPPPHGTSYTSRYDPASSDQHQQLHSQLSNEQLQHSEDLFNNRILHQEQHQQQQHHQQHHQAMLTADQRLGGGGQENEVMGDDEKTDDQIEHGNLQSLGQIEMAPYIKEEPMDYNTYNGEMELEEPLRQMQDLDPQQQTSSAPSTTFSKNTCPICSHIFSSSGNMKRHMRRRHGHKPAAVYKCRRTSTASSQSSPRGHPNGRFLSNLSNRKRESTSAATAASSTSSSTPGTLLNCSQCPFRCTTTALLDKHLINHAKMDRIADGFRCAYCTARARYRVYMRRHLATYHRDQPPLASQVLNNQVSTTFRDMTDPALSTHGQETKTAAKKDRGLDKLLSEFIGFLPTQDHFDEPTKCCNCDFETTDRAEIINHITTQHMSKKYNSTTNGKTGAATNHDVVPEHTFNCYYCPITSFDKDDIKRHVFITHCLPKTEEYKCPSCPFLSDEGDFLLNHMRISHQCSFDQYVTFTDRIKQNEEKDGTFAVYNESGEIVQDLNTMTLDLQPTNSPQKDVETLPNKENEMFGCLFCKYEDKTSFSIRQHIQSIHPECKISILNIKRKISEPRQFCVNNIETHMIIDDQLFYTCNICDKTFNDEQAVTHGLEVHNMDACNDCAYCFLLIASANNCSFKCDKCMKIFRDYGEFTRHRETHFFIEKKMEAGYVRCVACNYQNSKFKVRCHAARKHKIKQMSTFRETIQINKIVCLKQVKKYFNTIIPKIMICTFCNFTIDEDVNLCNSKHLEHLRKCHNAFVCAECNCCIKELRKNYKNSDYSCIDDSLMPAGGGVGGGVEGDDLDTTGVDTTAEDVELGNVASMEAFKRPLAIRNRAHPTFTCNSTPIRNRRPSNGDFDAGIQDGDQVLAEEEEELEFGELPSKKAKRMSLDKKILYSCLKCTYYSPRHKNIQSHCRKHLDYFPYRCAFCDFRSGFHSVIARHHKIVHNSNNSVVFKELVEKEALVDSCYEEVDGVQNKYVRRDISSSNLEDKQEKPPSSITCSPPANINTGVSLSDQFKCKKCPYTCSLMKRMRRHIQTHYNYRPYECPLCPFTAIIPNNFRIHARRKHRSSRGLLPRINRNAEIEKLVTQNITTSIKMKVKLSPKFGSEEGAFSPPIPRGKQFDRLPLNDFVVDGYNSLTCRYECDDCRFNTSCKLEYKNHMSDHPNEKQTISNAMGDDDDIEEDEEGQNGAEIDVKMETANGNTPSLSIQPSEDGDKTMEEGEAMEEEMEEGAQVTENSDSKSNQQIPINKDSSHKLNGKIKTMKSDPAPSESDKSSSADQHRQRYYKCGTCEQFFSERRRYIHEHHKLVHPKVPYTQECLLFTYTKPESLNVQSKSSVSMSKMSVGEKLENKENKNGSNGSTCEGAVIAVKDETLETEVVSLDCKPNERVNTEDNINNEVVESKVNGFLEMNGNDVKSSVDCANGISDKFQDKSKVCLKTDDTCVQNGNENGVCDGETMEEL